MKDGASESGMVKQGNLSPGSSGGDDSRRRVQLTEAQTTRVIEGAFAIAEDVGTVVKGLVAIHAIRVQAEADVGRIEAQTASIVAQTRAELERLKARGDMIGQRGDVAVRIINKVRELLEAVPDLDAPSRKALIDGLPIIISRTLKEE